MNVAYDYVTTAVFINSFFNPLVYCWRIREIRKAVMASLETAMKTPYTSYKIEGLFDTNTRDMKGSKNVLRR